MGNRLKLNKKRFLYPNEFEKMMDFCNSQQKFTFKCLINTGARINEIRNVEKRDLDEERNNILLRMTKVRARKGEKSPSPRIIAVSSQFFKYLKKEMSKQKILSTNASDVSIKKALIKSRVTNPQEISVHNLRKTFGTWMLALGVDGFKLAQHLGHTPNELARDYATNDVFNSKDKVIMRDILGDLPQRFFPESR